MVADKYISSAHHIYWCQRHHSTCAVFHALRSLEQSLCVILGSLQLCKVTKLPGSGGTCRSFVGVVLLSCSLLVGQCFVLPPARTMKGM